jgi:ligand-binding sensor domain-containing protein
MSFFEDNRRSSCAVPWLLVLAVCQLHGVVSERGAPLDSPEYLIGNWQTEDGLPQNSISAIAQTPDGYLWLGTFNGLVRFNGVRFTVFTSATSPGLLSDNINMLYVDRGGRLWICTDGGGLSCYEQEKFTALAGTNQVAASIVSGVAEDAKGNLWVGTAEGLYRLVSGNLAHVAAAQDGQPIGGVADMKSASDGKVWLAADEKLYCISEGKVALAPGFEGLTSVLPSRSSGLWYGGRQIGLRRYQSGKHTAYPGFMDWEFRQIYEARNGDLWVGSADRGLARLRGGEQRVFTTQDGLLANDVNALFEDQEGNLWVGTNGGGLHRFREKRLRTYTVREGLPGNDVVCLLEDRRGRVWIGSYGQGVCVWEGGQFRRLPGLPAAPDAVIALAEGRDGQLWLGVAGGRLISWQDGSATEEDLTAYEGARVVFEDRDGALWLGSKLRGVERRYGGKTIRYSRQEGLSHDYVTSIAQDKEGAIWVGTRQGLNRISAGRVERFSRREGLGADCIHTLYVDQEGVLWAGTAGGGLSCLRQGRFAAITTAQGLPNDVIGQILEDGLGNVWLGSNAGLCRVKRSELLACAERRTRWVQGLILNHNDGLVNPECAGSFQPACFRGRDGRLWFATVGGIVVVSPEQLAPGSLPPPVHVESVLADGRACLPTRGAPASPATVTVPPGVGRVELSYTGLSYVAPSRVRFRFRLVGTDKDWVEAGTRRTAYYPRLAPGRYRFEVIACNNDGVWNTTGDAVNLVVQPLWWQTGWCKALAALGLLGTTAGWTGATIWRRMRRKMELAEQRSTKLRAEELGAANQRLQVRTNELEEALAKVKVLTGLLPICATCKKIRDDKGYWNKVEHYITEHSDARFTHSICPDCAKRLYPELYDDPELQP